MSHNLIISRGLIHKKAQGLPGLGPSFEQQFGILANAQITDKYPALGPCKVLFQLQEKTDDNLFAVGAAVYKLGTNYIYIPAVFRKGKIWTGVIQYVPSMLRFLPLSLAWLSYVKNNGTGLTGTIVPGDMYKDIATDAYAARTRLLLDPFAKTASISSNVFDTALKMGKRASLLLLDKCTNIDYLNGALAFYKPLQLESFAKKALMQFKLIKPYIVTILDKQASALSALLQALLYRDGFIVKKAKSLNEDQQPLSVVRYSNPRTSFVKPTKSCKCKILNVDGLLLAVTIIKSIRQPNLNPVLMPISVGNIFGVSHDRPAKLSINNESGILYNIVDLDGYFTCSSNIMALVDSIEEIDVKSLGYDLKSLKLIPFSSLIITPKGLAFKVTDHYYKLSSGKFYSYNSFIILSLLDNLIKPMSNGSSILLPKGSRVIMPSANYNADGTKKTDNKRHQNNTRRFALDGVSIDSVLRKFITSDYNKVKVYSDGQLFSVISDKLDGTLRLQIKLAALHLVEHYNILPKQAKNILKLVLNKVAGKVSASLVYLILKKATIPGDAKDWLLANIGMSVTQSGDPLVNKTNLNDYTQNLALIVKNILTAVLSGVKLVFDMQILRLLILTADPTLLIDSAIPDFFNCLDKLCRILFVYQCHIDDMLLQYGAVKIQALAKSLLNTLKDLSLLAVFLKLRGLSKDTNNNPDVGLLLTGTYL